jgi:hypothetical protein
LVGLVGYWILVSVSNRFDAMRFESAESTMK